MDGIFIISSTIVAVEFGLAFFTDFQLAISMDFAQSFTGDATF
jgi:hypothetical protein